MTTTEKFVPALIVVDMQEDFCPPNGSLAVPGGREIAPLINKFLALPFALKVASQDWHPPDSKTFASQHSGAKPFASEATFNNPDDPGQTAKSTLWTDHCVRGTPGAELIEEIDSSKLDLVVKKGMDTRVEMFSAFSDMFGRKGSGLVSVDLAEALREKGVTHVYTVGLTGDCCVRHTSVDASREGFKTVAVWDATRSVTKEGEKAAKEQMVKEGVEIVVSDGKEMERVWAMGGL